jgi:nitrile hydratase subunit alpha
LAHSEDIDAHLKSIEEDMEYWRTKRLEPRVFRLLRKGEITFYDIVKSSDSIRADSRLLQSAENSTPEERVTALELRLGEFIRGIEVAASIIGYRVLAEESRDEAGVYNESYKLAHKKLEGSVEERISKLETYLEEEMVLLNALLKILTQKKLITLEKLDEMLSAPQPPRYENGAMIVARAWLDPAFKADLMTDAKGTLRELGFALNRTPKLVVLEDTESVRHVIVCTLCSCYPYELLGNPPWWYKHDSYKQAIVKEPRRTLESMFKFVVPENVEISVYDSTSDIRYIVLPKRPDGTVGMGERELAGLVTQESLIGVGPTLSPIAREKEHRRPGDPN